MRFELHPDGIVTVRDNEGVLYQESVEAFEKDHGDVFPDLPENMVSCVYDTETRILVYYDAKHNAFPVEGKYNWAFAGGVLDNLPGLKAARNSRIAKEEADARARAEARAQEAQRAEDAKTQRIVEAHRARLEKEANEARQKKAEEERAQRIAHEKRTAQMSADLPLDTALDKVQVDSTHSVVI